MTASRASWAKSRATQHDPGARPGGLRSPKPRVTSLTQRVELGPNSPRPSLQPFQSGRVSEWWLSVNFSFRVSLGRVRAHVCVGGCVCVRLCSRGGEGGVPEEFRFITRVTVGQWGTACGRFRGFSARWLDRGPTFVGWNSARPGPYPPSHNLPLATPFHSPSPTISNEAQVMALRGLDQAATHRGEGYVSSGGFFGTVRLPVCGPELRGPSKSFSAATSFLRSVKSLELHRLQNVEGWAASFL